MVETAAPAVRMVVIAKQWIWATALSQLLAADTTLSVLGPYQDVAAAPLTALKPTVLLMELDACGSDLVQTLRDCREKLPDLRICILSPYRAAVVMQRCLNAQADGYIVSDASVAELINAVKTVGVGLSYIDARLAAGALRRQNGTGPGDELTPRETEIIRLIARGQSNKEIAGELHLAERTVKNYISPHLFKAQRFSAHQSRHQRTEGWLSLTSAQIRRSKGRLYTAFAMYRIAVVRSIIVAGLFGFRGFLGFRVRERSAGVFTTPGR
jgi:DNA-binding NarL/FixJ family response regulator